MGKTVLNGTRQVLKNSRKICAVPSTVTLRTELAQQLQSHPSLFYFLFTCCSPLANWKKQSSSGDNIDGNHDDDDDDGNGMMTMIMTTTKVAMVKILMMMMVRMIMMVF